MYNNANERETAQAETRRREPKMIETITAEQFANDTVNNFDLIRIVDFDGIVLEYSTAELVIETGDTLAQAARGLAYELGEDCEIVRETFADGSKKYTVTIKAE